MKGLYTELLETYGPLTTLELAEMTGNRLERVQWNMRTYPELYRIVGWRETASQPLARWGVADGQPNAPKTEITLRSRPRGPLALLKARRRGAATPWDGLGRRATRQPLA